VAQPHRPAPSSASNDVDAAEESAANDIMMRSQAELDESAEDADSWFDEDTRIDPAPLSRLRPDLGPRHWAVLAACALLGTMIGIVGYQLRNSLPPATPSVAPTTAAPSTTSVALVSAQITPVSPSGTSLTMKEGAWRSQRYNDVNFGNLKSGIGLVLDLRTARPLTAVTFTAKSGPMTVELRAGDVMATDGMKMRRVGPAVQANGYTTLPASTAGSHRYWMIWVTQLPPDLQAKIANPVAMA
jgi:hypothetical protein